MHLTFHFLQSSARAPGNWDTWGQGPRSPEGADWLEFMLVIVAHLEGTDKGLPHMGTELEATAIVRVLEGEMWEALVEVCIQSSVYRRSKHAKL